MYEVRFRVLIGGVDMLRRFMAHSLSTRTKIFASTVNGVKGKGKGKAIPLQPWTGPEGSRRLRLPDFKTIHESGNVVSPTHRSPLTPRKFSWYTLLLEAESTPES